MAGFSQIGKGPVVRVTGAGGRIGRILRAAWGEGVDNGAGVGLVPLWSSRNSALCSASGGRAQVIVNLAGVTAGPALGDNTALALAALEEGAREGARVILVSSAAVYGAPSHAVDEDAPLAPLSPYGAAKVAMERAAAGRAAAILRIGNVAGADALLGAMGTGCDVILDRFDDGTTPRRSTIGPRTLARVLAALVVQVADGATPGVLNVAEPGAVAMADLVRAAGRDPRFRPAPATAIALVELDVTRLCARVVLPPADPARMVAEWRELA